MSIQQASPLFTINSVAPIRICDIGGWTDTWWELEHRLAVIYLGNAQASSKAHEMVIQGLEDAHRLWSRLKCSYCKDRIGDLNPLDLPIWHGRWSVLDPR